MIDLGVGVLAILLIYGRQGSLLVKAFSLAAFYYVWITVGHALLFVLFGIELWEPWDEDAWKL